MATLKDLALRLRPMIEKAAVSLDDADALSAVELFPQWSADAAYSVNDRVRYNNILYRCLQNHSAQENWTPVAAPSIWAKVLIPDENVIPEWEQPDSTNAYKIGDKVRYNDRIYESVINNNVWAPDVYGWTLVVEV